MKRKAALHNLGCKVNAYETEAMTEALKNAGYEIVPFAEGADVYVINTCTVTNIADRKSRQMLHRAKEMNPDAIVVAAGCYVEDAKDKLKTDPAVDLMIGNGDKAGLVAALAQHFAGVEASADLDDISTRHAYEALSISAAEDRTRAVIKIQDGCNQFCSYCMIPYVRGRVRSRQAEDILSEVRRLSKAGYREMVLTGIHISSYGLDFLYPGQNRQTPYADKAETNHHLLDLIRRISEVEGVKRIRLGSLEPGIMTEEFVRGIEKIDKICPQFHLSLQSGCDRTLARMKRKYDTASYERICAMLRSCFTDPAITTDIITGFPGETEEEFEETVRFVRRIGFAKTHIFPYSVRKGTAASKMPGQNTAGVKKARSKVLTDLDKENRHRYASRFEGREVEVLFEEEKTLDGQTCLFGHTRELLEAYLIPGSAEDVHDLAGEVLTLKAGTCTENGALLVRR